MAVPNITLEQLIALNDEIAALVRSGVPLESGLAGLSHDVPGRLGQFAAAIVDRTGRGESLTEVLADERLPVPRVYRAVVEAGLNAGRLPAALESLSSSLRRLVDTRRSILVAQIYPFLLLIAAWALFAFTVGSVMPQLAPAYHEMGTPVPALFVAFDACRHGIAIWGPLGPLVMIVAACAYWIGTNRAAMAGPRAVWLMGWLPWLNQSILLSQAAVFADILALLIDNRVPLDEALRLAGETSGDRRLARTAADMAEGVRRGDAAISPRRGRLPPLLFWLIGGGARNETLLPSLRHMAESYHQRAQLMADTARVMLPVIFSFCIGGAIVLVYGLGMLTPYFMMLKSLAGQ